MAGEVDTVAASKDTHKHRGKAADELRETNEKLVKQLAGQRLIEGVLRENSQIFRAILDALPLGVSLAEDRKLTWANAAFMKIHGFKSPNEYIGQSTEILFAKHDEFVRVGEILYSDLEMGNIAELSAKQKRNDGSVFDAHLQLTLFSAPDAESRVVVCCTTDMSEQSEAEARLRRSEERYRASLEESFDGAMIAKGSKVLFANSRIREMLGYSREEFEGIEYSRFLHPDYRELVVQRVAARMRGESVPGYYDVKFLRRDGSILDAELSARVVEIDGETCIQAWVRDVSEHKEAEEALQQSEERYRTLVEESFDGVVIYDGTRIVFANSRLCEILGYSKEELEGMDLLVTVHPDDREVVGQRAVARRHGENVPATYEFKILRKDGSAIEVETNARVIRIHGEPRVQAWIRDISERKKTETALRKSEERYRVLVEGSFDGIMIHDGTKIVFANSRLCEMMGYTKEEIEGMDHWLTLHADSRDIATRRSAARIRGDEAHGYYQVKQLRKDGSSFDAEINARPIEVQGVVGVQVWIKDISRREKAEEEARKSQERYRTLVEQSFDGVLVHDGKKIQFSNSRLCEMLGYRKEELEGMDVELIIHPDHRKLVKERIIGRMQGEDVPSLYELKLLRKNGATVEAETNARAVVLEGRTVVQSWIRDISERKKTEEALQRSEANYRAIFDSVNDAIFVHNMETGTVLDVNRKMCEMYGYTREQAIGLSAGEPSFSEDKDEQELALQLVTKAARGEPQVFEWQTKAKDGRSFWVEVNLRKAILSDKPYVLAVVRDITDRKRAETERENLRHQLLHAQKMEALGTLVGGIAHDFNNLLTIVLGYSELLLLEKGDDDPGRADLQKIIDAGSSGAALVQRMLTFSEQTDSVLGPLDLNDEIQKMEELLSRTIPKMISLELNTAEDLALVDADAGQLQQIIMNLALNAVEAMPDGGKLTIQTKNLDLEEMFPNNPPGMKPGKYVLLSVSDTGRGMSTEIMERMYDPFFTTKNRDFVKGTGLGLAILHGILMAHGGSIACSSEPGKGTRFDLYFPALSVEKAIHDEQPRDSSAAVSSSRGNETILLVDDEEMVRDLGIRILERAGYKVLTARNGKDALEVYSKGPEKIALVILDLIMPEMGGERCLEELLRINPKARIVISTGYASSDETTRMRIEALASSFVSKPFTLSNMLKTVREVLDRE